MRKKTPHLKVAIDFGASATKAVGSVEIGGEINCLLFVMTPHCLKVEDISLTPNPEFDENSTWVQLGQDSYVVGRLAAIKYHDEIKVRPAKVTNAIPKIWAVVALFARKFNLPDKFKLSIVFVLPPAEWEQRIILEERLKSFEVIKIPSGIISPTLVNVSSWAEGTGVLLSQGINLRTAGLVTAVMLGFRNASIVTSDYGSMVRPQTSDLGFHSLLKDVASGTGYNIEDAIEPVFKYRQALLTANTATAELETHTYKMERSATSNPDRQMYQDLMIQDKAKIAASNLAMQHSFDLLLRCTNEDREIERKIAIKAVENATANYVRRLADWLDEMLPTQSDLICLCGGTANYLGTALDSFLIDKLRSRAKKDLCMHSRLIIPAAIKQQVDADRFADIYSLWHHMTDRTIATK
jgi:hypothetical protein